MTENLIGQKRDNAPDKENVSNSEFNVIFLLA